MDFNKFLSFIPLSGNLLDIGCGIGSVDFEIAKFRKDIKICGIDISERSIHSAQKSHKHQNIEYKAIDFLSLNEKFDLIFMVDVFHHLHPNEKVLMLNEIKKRLKPGCSLLIVDVNRKFGLFGMFLDKFIGWQWDTDMLNFDEALDLLKDCGYIIDYDKSELKFKFLSPVYYILAKSQYLNQQDCRE